MYRKRGFDDGDDGDDADDDDDDDDDVSPALLYLPLRCSVLLKCGVLRQRLPLATPSSGEVSRAADTDGGRREYVAWLRSACNHNATNEIKLN
jgi:hypothetical protein